MFNIFKRSINSKVDTNVYMLIILFLAIAACYFQPIFIPFALVIVGVTYYFSQRNQIYKELYFSSYMDNIIRNIERTNHFAVRKLNIGMAVFSKEGKLQWKNDLFQHWIGKKNLEGKKPEEILPLQENAFEILSVRDGEKIIQIEDRYYNMRYFRVQTQEKFNDADDSNISGLMIYLYDITDFELLRQKYDNDKLCLAYAKFDNYEEVTRGLSETNIANLNGEFNELLTKWVAEEHGFICRMNKEQSLLGFSQSAVIDCMSNKFPVLDKVREIKSGNKIAPTLSIGVSCDGNTLEELIQNANKSLYMALGRGGDQAVVSLNKNVQFFGGTSAVNAKNTRVRARIVAQTIHEQMMLADKVFVMGHAMEDFDAIGGAVGMAKLALSLNKETYIVISGRNETFDKIAELLERDDINLSEHDAHYLNIVLDEAAALEKITSKSLLVLVDHHRRSITASQKVLDSVPAKIIIDHHRRAEDIIDDTILLYLEPSSSSTSELVTELVGYFDDRLDISVGEANVLYAGIVLDTKNFAVQTGPRTFDAAALLRRSGADPNLIRLLFKDDMQSLQMRAKLLAEARVPFPGLAVSVLKNADKEIKASILAAQTADALITINGICVGIAIVEYKDNSIGISARSDGSVNVQVVMEKLGGGGHQTVAGVQIADKNAVDVENTIVDLVKKQLEERDKNESDSVARY